jgi:hypothetical protein
MGTRTGVLLLAASILAIGGCSSSSSPAPSSTTALASCVQGLDQTPTGRLAIQHAAQHPKTNLALPTEAQCAFLVPLTADLKKIKVPPPSVSTDLGTPLGMVYALAEVQHFCHDWKTSDRGPTKTINGLVGFYRQHPKTPDNVAQWDGLFAAQAIYVGYAARAVCPKYLNDYNTWARNHGPPWLLTLRGYQP